MRGCFLVANYNKQAYIAECLHSLFNQTDLDELDLTMDVILIDDASKDHSLEIVADFVKKNKGLKVIMNKKHRGIGKTRNMLLEEAINGGYDFLIVMDSDDIAYPTLAHNAAAQIKEGADVVYTSYNMFGCHYRPIDGLPIVIEAPDEDKITVKAGAGKQNVSHGGLCVSKDFFSVLYPEIQYGEDHEYLYKLMDCGAKFKKIPVVWDEKHLSILNSGYIYMRNPGGVSITHKKEIDERDRKFFEMLGG